MALAFLAARSLALLSGAVTGVGGVWLALLIRAQLACEAFDAAPDKGCESSGVEPFAILSVIVLAVGLVLSARAWRRRAGRGRSTASVSSSR